MKKYKKYKKLLKSEDLMNFMKIIQSLIIQVIKYEINDKC